MTNAPPLPDYSRLLRHNRVALMYSGGKDSDVLLSLFAPFLEGITVYHGDAGDLLPEVAKHVAEVAAAVPHFKRVESDARAWISANATPSDLVPADMTPMGRKVKGGRRNVVTLYECCNANRWQPWTARLLADGITLAIYGQRNDELHRQLLPDHTVFFGIEAWQPLSDWSGDDVWSYIRANRVPVSAHYDLGGRRMRSPECARCPASWDEGRADYLRRFHPALAGDYKASLQEHARDIYPVLDRLQSELRRLS
jgi:3'-phosphoadenosine 5'-phosphosulfate sulfotransferase (PAPS reductase)/FAD synthetase